MGKDISPSGLSATTMKQEQTAKGGAGDIKL